ncbi:MAG: hypothetical protein ACXVFQ_21920 [Solirubrobacteraceae bacterium]
MAFGGMEADVRDAIAVAAVRDGAGIVFAGSVLIGSGHKAAR